MAPNLKKSINEVEAEADQILLSLVK
jgi:hypothetical protein